jgi:acyl-CoA hydrolase
METQTYITHHLIKSEDLNHHGTLYAGRTAEWFVESGFIAAASLTDPQNIVCLTIHGMTFKAPVHRGDMVRFESKVVDTGKTRIITHIRVLVRENLVVEGFITFVNVDLEGRPLPHGIQITVLSQEDMELQMKARSLQT